MYAALGSGIVGIAFGVWLSQWYMEDINVFLAVQFIFWMLSFFL